MNNSLKPLFEAPDVVHHLGPWAWFGLILLALISLLVSAFAVAALSGKAALWTIVGASLLLSSALYGMLRAVPPGLGAEWWYVVAPVLLLTLGVAYLGLRASKPSESFDVVAGTVLAVLAAAYLDKANEYLGGIPLCWGVVGLAVLGIFLVAKSR